MNSHCSVNEDLTITVIDSLYDAIDAGEAPGALLRQLALGVSEERELELERVLAYLETNPVPGAATIADMLKTKAHRR